MTHTLHPGDRVRLLDAEGEGTVVHIAGQRISVDMDGMEMQFDARELVRVEHDGLLRNHTTPVEITQKDRALRTQGKQKLADLHEVHQAVYELDLHIHELLDHYGHMSNGEILQHQMQACRSFVREAIEKRYKKIVLIHGVGEGVLKQEIHRFLDQLSHIEYHDAPYRTYGYGATEVLIHR
jgi:dsDNA-specific endonuclease/ATPase MutS2